MCQYGCINISIYQFNKTKNDTLYMYMFPVLINKSRCPSDTLRTCTTMILNKITNQEPIKKN